MYGTQKIESIFIFSCVCFFRDSGVGALDDRLSRASISLGGGSGREHDRHAGPGNVAMYRRGTVHRTSKMSAHACHQCSGQLAFRS
jgi:hypothetical protein